MRLTKKKKKIHCLKKLSWHIWAILQAEICKILSDIQRKHRDLWWTKRVHWGQVKNIIFSMNKIRHICLVWLVVQSWAVIPTFSDVIMLKGSYNFFQHHFAFMIAFTKRWGGGGGQVGEKKKIPEKKSLIEIPFLFHYPHTYVDIIKSYFWQTFQYSELGGKWSIV